MTVKFRFVAPPLQAVLKADFRNQLHLTLSSPLGLIRDPPRLPPLMHNLLANTFA